MTIAYDSLYEQLQREVRGEVGRNVPMANHTTWRVGGAAELFVAPEDSSDLEKILRILDAGGCPWICFGYGGNILVRDKGIRGAVIHTRNLNRLQIEEDGRIVAGAGVPLMFLIRKTMQLGLAGIGALAGIPATLGGAISMNAGAHGQQIGEVVRNITVCSATGCMRIDAEQLKFDYRSSLVPKQSVISEVTLQLRPAEPEVVEQNMLAAIEHRRQAHPHDGHNAGSVFKNPAVKAAWRLIDEAGLRGRTLGGARISDKHTNFILNDGKATAADIEGLIRLVQERVYENAGVRLETEVQVLGEK